MSNPYEVVSQPGAANYAGPLVDFSGLSGVKPATKQKASTAPAGQDWQKIGQNLGQALMRLANPPGMGTPTQAGAPLQLTPQQSVAPVNNPGSPFNVTGGLY